MGLCGKLGGQRKGRQGWEGSSGDQKAGMGEMGNWRGEVVEKGQSWGMGGQGRQMGNWKPGNGDLRE